MIYVVTQDGLDNYPIEDDDIIKTIVTTIGVSNYIVTLERATVLNGKPDIALGNYIKEEAAVEVIKDIASMRARSIITDGWYPCYFMPKEDEDD